MNNAQPSDHFHDSKQSTTSNQIRFESPEKYPELSTNQDLNKFAHHIQKVRGAVQSIKTDEVATRGAQVTKVDELFHKQNKELDILANKAMAGIETTINQATAALYSNKTIDSSQYHLQTVVLEQYKAADTRGKSELLANENSAKILATLTKNGLLPDKTLNIIDRAHTPHLLDTIENAVNDVQSLKSMQKEYGLFQTLNRNTSEADRLRSTQFRNAL